MKTSLLALALLAGAVPSRAIAPQDLALITVEQAATHLNDCRLRAAQMESAFVDNAARKSSDPDGLLRCVAELDQFEAKKEREFREWHDSKIAAWNAQAVAGSITADEAERRAGFVDRIFQVRMLLLCGAYVPDQLDACSEGRDGKPNGRYLAGPQWGFAASYEDIELAQKELIRLSGLSREDVFVH